MFSLLRAAGLLLAAFIDSTPQGEIRADAGKPNFRYAPIILPPAVSLPRKKEKSIIIDLKGRRAIVTGSTAGIGRATAEGLAWAGASVVVSRRGAERVKEAVRRMQAAFPEAGISGIAADLSTAEGLTPSSPKRRRPTSSSTTWERQLPRTSPTSPTWTG